MVSRLQFRILHLSIAVLVFAALFASIRFISRRETILGGSYGIALAHVGALVLIGAVARGSRFDLGPYLPTKLILAWLGVITATGALMAILTGDTEFAQLSGIWFGTAFFWCGLAIYEVCRPYLS